MSNRPYEVKHMLSKALPVTVPPVMNPILPLTPYEQHLALTYLANVASRFHHWDESAGALTHWIGEYAGTLGMEITTDVAGNAAEAEDDALSRRHNRPKKTRHIRTMFGKVRLKARFEDTSDTQPSRQEWQDILATIRARCETTRNVPADRTAQRLRTLGDVTGLSDTDVTILEFLFRNKTHMLFGAFVESFSEVIGGVWARHSSIKVKDLLLPTILGLAPDTILRRFMPGAPLMRTGLVSVDNDGDICINDRLHRLSMLPDDDDGIDVTSVLLDAATPGELEWSDFDHLERDRDHIEALLAGALRDGARGVNILVYGPPGTGKTEFCKTLAAKLGVTLYGVGEFDEDRREPNRHERLNELQLAQCLVTHTRRSLLLFDEMEDLLASPGLQGAVFGMGASGQWRCQSKIFMHRLLEETATPILWTSNVAEDIEPTVLRRMKFALELRLPSPKIRTRVWSRQLSRHGIEASEDDARALAQEFTATPGVAAGATAAAQLIGGDLDTVRHGVRSLSRLLSIDTPPQRTPDTFDTALMSADEDVVRLADQLERHGERRFSLCLQGPPGTGKSAFVRYLAERLDLEVLQKRTSNLMSMWVGATEKNIARAFAEARDTKAFLVFDEADSLLADRSRAVRNWEVSQVNEMLTWMESHPFPFACTTNHSEGLDPASLRRFTFKITLDYLTPDQIAATFRAYFDLTPPKALTSLTSLTPGDFAVVRRKAEVMRRLDDATALADMLRAECDAKPNRTRPICFRP